MKENDVIEKDGFLFKKENAPFPEKAIVACQGIAGAYSQITAKRLFPKGTFIYFKNFAAVVKAVREGLCEYGVLPIENNTYGSVKAVYGLLDNDDFNIVRGYRLKIDHQLLGKPGVRLSEIRKVISHEQALGQCEQSIQSLGKQVVTEAVPNTAVAARMVAEGDRSDVAAISSPECAEIYGLSVLKRHMADQDQNYTRFLCIARNKVVYPGADRISMILTLPHKPGALYNVLGEFARRDINLLKLESEPIPGRNFEFKFYLDIAASVFDPAVREMLGKIKRVCPTFRYLGNYEELMR